ncbi:DUF3016 domain-containing protein [Massilia glaciei]|uniref:DUF3016 domain-containing protein n=2 Tax=Massilia glaciei TaxID=1524097 RepID=A0A2U2HIU5_9BURK|nr:DUF3016 domain-containing protein [Massilia glaciei]
MKSLASPYLQLGRRLGAAAALALAAGSASAGVKLRFTDPGNFADMPFAAAERARVLEGLTEHFEKLGATLPAGQELDVEVLDLDLAGRVDPTFSRHQDVRVLRNGADWPSMRLRYTLRAGGQVIDSAEQNLSNMMYLDRVNRHDKGDLLRYEKQMIDEWFKEKIVPVRQGLAATR